MLVKFETYLCSGCFKCFLPQGNINKLWADEDYLENLDNLERLATEAGWLVISETDEPKAYCPACRKTLQTVEESNDGHD